MQHDKLFILWINFKQIHIKKNLWDAWLIFPLPDTNKPIVTSSLFLYIITMKIFLPLFCVIEYCIWSILVPLPRTIFEYFYISWERILLVLHPARNYLSAQQNNNTKMIVVFVGSPTVKYFNFGFLFTIFLYICIAYVLTSHKQYTIIRRRRLWRKKVGQITRWLANGYCHCCALISVFAGCLPKSTNCRK